LDALLNVVSTQTLIEAAPMEIAPDPTAPIPVSEFSSPRVSLGPALDLKYRDVYYIGGGTYGSVYQALDVSTGHHVAIKTQAKGQVAKKEVEVQNAVAYSKHCSKILAIEESDDAKSLLIVMPLCRQLPKYCTSEAELLQILKGCARGLWDLHFAGYYHMDVKPDNILLGPRNEAILCDFGLAEQYDSCGMISAECQGTLEFMAPEVLLASGKYSAEKADVYSLAQTIRTLACGNVIGPDLQNLLRQMEAYDVKDRISIQEVLEHPLLRYI
jgi:serine/threonine protein kinase